MWTELNRFVLSLYTRAQIKKDEGQALVEYTLILALVSIAVIAVLSQLSGAVSTELGKVITAL